MKDHFEMM
jgi:hypothetical protein